MSVVISHAEAAKMRLYKDVFYGKVRLVVLQKYDFSFIFYRFSDGILQMQIVFFTYVF